MEEKRYIKDKERLSDKYITSVVILYVIYLHVQLMRCTWGGSENVPIAHVIKIFQRTLAIKWYACIINGSGRKIFQQQTHTQHFAT